MKDRATSLRSIAPRGLTREDAAAYCGLTPSAFSDWVRRGIVPGPIRGTQRWDRKAIDLALDRASGIQSGSEEKELSPFELWRLENESSDARH